jgi:hypothetical protein
MLTDEEAAFFTESPTTNYVDNPTPGSGPSPGTQGRLALMIDIPPTDLVAGDNTVEFVTQNINAGYPSYVCNIDLVMQTN